MTMGNDRGGTVCVPTFVDGLRGQDIHTERYFSGLQNSENPEYRQMPYSLVEAGWTMGYLNTAIREYGYRMHTYGAMNLPNAVIGTTIAHSYKEGINTLTVPSVGASEDASYPQHRETPHWTASRGQHGVEPIGG